MLNADAYEVIIKNEQAMNPAIVIGYREECDEHYPEECVLEDETKKKAMTTCYLPGHVDDEPQSTEDWEEADEKAGDPACTQDSDLTDDAGIDVFEGAGDSEHR